MRTGPWKSPKLSFVLLALLFGKVGLAQKDAAGKKEEAPVKAEMMVSFERPTIREDDKVPVRIVVSNPSDKALSNVTLTWGIPSAVLALYSVSCEDVSNQPLQALARGTPGFTWQTIPSNSDPQSVQTHDFCLVSSTAAEDTLNLVFVLRYAWTENGSPRHAAVTVEKPIKSAFLGSDTLAGIPLGLVSFVVPGLLFWLLLDWWQTPWRVQGDVLGDKMIYSVLVSVTLIGLLGLSPWLKTYVNITSGLSMTKIYGLALAGTVSGWLVGSVDHFWARYRDAQALHAGDTDPVLFEKLLRVNKGKRRPTTLVQTTTGIRYRGSVGARTAAGTFLMGWYRIQGAHGQLRTKIQKLIQSGDYTAALKTARKNQIAVTERDFIYERPQAGEEHQAAQRMRLTTMPAEVTEPLEVTDNAADEPPLVLE